MVYTEVFIYPSIILCIFKQIIDMMPIPVGIVPVLVNEFLTVYILRSF